MSLEEHFGVALGEPLVRLNEKYLSVCRRIQEIEAKDHITEEEKIALNESKVRKRFYEKFFNDIKNLPPKQPQKATSEYQEELFQLLSIGPRIRGERGDHKELERVVDDERKDCSVPKKDLKEVAEVGKMFVPTFASRDKSLASVLESSHQRLSKSFAAKSQVIESIKRSNFYHKEVEISPRISVTNWLGGSIKNWLERHKDDIVGQVSIRLGQVQKNEFRLTNHGRLVIRGIMNCVGILHAKDCAIGDLKEEDLAVDENSKVTLIHFRYKSGSTTDFKSDYDALILIISNILGNRIPKDVDHLIKLLGARRYTSDTRDQVFFHSCLWTDTETAMNIIAFYNYLKDESVPLDIRTLRDKKIRDIAEEKQQWEREMLQHEMYKSALSEWVQRLRGEDYINNPLLNFSGCSLDDIGLMGISSILSAMNMLLSYIHLHAENSNWPYDKTVKQLYVFFPKFMPHFLEATSDDTGIKAIYKFNR